MDKHGEDADAADDRRSPAPSPDRRKEETDGECEQHDEGEVLRKSAERYGGRAPRRAREPSGLSLNLPRDEVHHRARHTRRRLPGDSPARRRSECCRIIRVEGPTAFRAAMTFQIPEIVTAVEAGSFRNAHALRARTTAQHTADSHPWKRSVAMASLLPSMPRCLDAYPATVLPMRRATVLIVSGVVPQQPPTIVAPASSQSSTASAYCSGEMRPRSCHTPSSSL
jgi:hypothetical protein